MRITEEGIDRMVEALKEQFPVPPFELHDRCERYLRVTVDIPGGSVEAGLQRSIGEPIALLASEYERVITEECLALNGDGINDDSAPRIIDALEIRLLQLWPARLWFVEFWNLDKCLTQTYAPSWRRR